MARNFLRAVIFDLGGTLMYERSSWHDITAQGDEALTKYLINQGMELNLSTFPVEFRRRLGEYFSQEFPGAVVKLSNGETGIIISINPDHPLKPSLLIYDAGIPGDEALICQMEKHEEIAMTAPSALKNRRKTCICT